MPLPLLLSLAERPRARRAAASRTHRLVVCQDKAAVDGARHDRWLSSHPAATRGRRATLLPAFRSERVQARGSASRRFRSIVEQQSAELDGCRWSRSPGGQLNLAEDARLEPIVSERSVSTRAGRFSSSALSVSLVGDAIDVRRGAKGGPKRQLGFCRDKRRSGRLSSLRDRPSHQPREQGYGRRSKRLGVLITRLPAPDRAVR
jgi:hypothetical protein